MFRMIGAILLGGAAAFAPHAVAAQSWQPTKPITIVIPFPPGPGLDLVARMVGDRLSSQIGQPVVYENRSGASGSIAAEYVARAAPDGTTLMAAATSTHATNVHLIKNLSYDPIRNFTPIVTSVETIGSLVVNRNVVPVNSVMELVDYAKKNPGKLSFGSSGAGSFFHLAGELFNLVAGVKMTHVPYRGSVAAFTDLIGGHIQVNFTQLSQAMVYRDNPALKVLAVLETVRFSRIRNTRRSATNCRRSGCRRPGTASSARPECRSRRWRGSMPNSLRRSTSPRSKASWKTTVTALLAARPKSSASA